MLLSEVFLPEFIKFGLVSTQKQDLFREMVDHFMKAQGSHVDAGGESVSAMHDSILTALNEREKKMSTGIQHGIAIPHGKTNAVDRVYGVIGVSEKGIEYDSLDGEPVHVVLMILAPPVQAESHLLLLQNMAVVLRNPSFYDDVMRAKNAEEVFSILKQYEGHI
ncbi:PTS fructose transporter subunit IIA [Spirochaetia bacterium]|nr:PTS fructose transporter subunit IIA [Spirochaetia bacterium]